MLPTASYQRKTGNCSRHGIREIRLMPGNARGLKRLRGFKGMRIPLLRWRVLTGVCGE